jgi:hypothetical protein
VRTKIEPGTALMKLTAPARVHWLDEGSATVLPGVRIRSFETLHEAVGFVMETLEQSRRPTAFIRTDMLDRLEFAEISTIYASEEYRVFRA